MSSAAECILAEVPFPLYGLPPSFRGLRWIAEHDQLPSVVVLGHGDPRQTPEKWLKSGVILKASSPGELGIYDTLETRLHAAQGEVHERLSNCSVWSQIALDIEGSAVAFSYLEAAGDWVAFGELEDSWLFVHSRDIELGGVTLVRVEVDAYLRGLSKLLS